MCKTIGVASRDRGRGSFIRSLIADQGKNDEWRTMQSFKKWQQANLADDGWDDDDADWWVEDDKAKVVGD